MDYCAHCKKVGARQMCAGCHGALYCSAEHQKLDWPKHRATCKHLQAAATAPGGVVRVVTAAAPEGAARPTHGSRVTMKYKGYLPSGKVFDEGDGFTFTLGAGEVIRGWDEGVKLMALGEKATLYIVANSAYGPRGCPPVIPPNYPLCFDVELLAIN